MSRLVRAELLKVRTTRLWWGLMLGALALVALNATLSAVFAGQQGAPGLDTDAGVRNVWAAAGQGNLFALIAGILLVAGEYRHQTVTSTFLVTPSRSRVVAAKLAVAALVGLGYALAACLLTAAFAVPLLAARETAGSADVPVILGGAVLVTVLYGVVGVGVGALVRNQVAAVVGALLWVFVTEALVVTFLPEVGKWLPGGAASAIVQATVPGGTLLPAWAGTLLLVAYALLLAGLGARFALRRDIT